MALAPQSQAQCTHSTGARNPSSPIEGSRSRFLPSAMTTSDRQDPGARLESPRGAGRLQGRVAIVTGGGSGLGRAYAHALAADGAAVVVNDLGVALDGASGDRSVAARTVAEIEDAGGRAVESRHDVADWDQAHDLVDLAVSTFGDVHALVTSAGFLRDRTLARMSEDEWDAVVRVHLKGQAAPAHHALAYWRGRAAEGHADDRSIVHVASASGLRPAFGQANYGAAKLGVVGLAQVAALEGARYGVRANVIAPSARTRMTAADPVLASSEASDPVRFDPTAIAPIVAWLVGPTCPANRQIIYTDGRRLYLLSLPSIVARIDRPGRWTPEDLDVELGDALVTQPDLDELLS